MLKPEKNQRRQEHKSASDFEQWLNEINMFAHEIQSELDEISGLLRQALAGEPSPMVAVATSEPSPSPKSPSEQSSGNVAPPTVMEEGDPLAAIKRKLAQQLRNTQSASSDSKATEPSERSKTPFHVEKTPERSNDSPRSDRYS